MMGFFGVYVCALLFVFFIYKLKKKNHISGKTGFTDERTQFANAKRKRE